jgi:hypothetical protein
MCEANIPLNEQFSTGDAQCGCPRILSATPTSADVSEDSVRRTKYLGVVGTAGTTPFATLDDPDTVVSRDHLNV